MTAAGSASIEWKGRDFRSGEPIVVRTSAGRIADVGPVPNEMPADEFIAPGFIDLQVNGYGGVNFLAAALCVEDVRTVVRRLRGEGVTQFLATLTTESPGRIESALRRLASAMAEEEIARAVIGVHLEGPFISPEEGPRGAHPLEHCRRPDWELFSQWQEAASGAIRMITMAPELEGAEQFIRRAAASGVRVAIGHTAANREEILRGIDAGAALATHLGNAAHDRIQRHRNYIFDQLGDDRLMASLILDGHHLPPHLAKIFVRAKGIERIVLISDAVEHAGMPPGIYEGFGQQVEVRSDGFVGLVGQPRLAGSGTNLRVGVENLLRFCGCSLGQAIDAATIQPARFLGLENEYGSIRVGLRGNLLRLRYLPEMSRIETLGVVAA